MVGLIGLLLILALFHYKSSQFSLYIVCIPHFCCLLADFPVSPSYSSLLFLLFFNRGFSHGLLIEINKILSANDAQRQVNLQRPDVFKTLNIKDELYSTLTIQIESIYRQIDNLVTPGMCLYVSTASLIIRFDLIMINSSLSCILFFFS